MQLMFLKMQKSIKILEKQLKIALLFMQLHPGTDQFNGQ
jgi:hypothetical protein